MKNTKPKLAVNVVIGSLIVASAFYLTRTMIVAPQPINFEGPAERLKNGAPDFEVARIARDEARNSPLTLKSSSRPLTLVNFWATWCEPCVKEWPSIIAMAKALGPEKVRVIAISVDSEEEVIRPFLEKFKDISEAPIEIGWDPTMVTATQWGTEKIPETYVLNRKFQLLSKVIDAQHWTADSVLKLLNEWAQNDGH